MLNQTVVVGRIQEINRLEKETVIKIAVPKCYKNENGEYDTDYITFNLYGTLAENIVEYCKNGDLLGIKGRIETNNILIAEKVTFLSSKKESGKENE